MSATQFFVRFSRVTTGDLGLMQNELLSWITDALEITKKDIWSWREIKKEEWSTVGKISTSRGDFAIKTGNHALASEIAAYEYLGALGIAACPRLRASRISDANHWMCLEWIDGSIYGDKPSLSVAQAAAAALVDIQLKSELNQPAHQGCSLPDRTPLVALGNFDQIIEYLDRNLERALTDYLRYAPPGIAPIGRDLSERVNRVKPELEALCAELAGAPIAIDHGDLHARNFGSRLPGRAFLLDWSNAGWSVPFVSFELLFRVITNTLGIRHAEAIKQSYLRSFSNLDPSNAERAMFLSRGLCAYNQAWVLIRREQLAELSVGSLAWIVARWLNQVCLFTQEYY